ncbi:MAG: tRNA (adenosine(37)-N6)-dimethylallyltransferase MiaA, partial [bacterium]
MVEKPLLPVVAGPTASGKTAIAVALCRLIEGEVV